MNKGVSLLELLIAVSLIVVAITMMALLIPRASNLSFDSRMRWQATELARSTIEQYKTKSFSLIPITPTATTIQAQRCDCRKLTNAQLSAIAPTPQTLGSTTYQVRACINFVDWSANTWQGICSPESVLETPTKYVRVQVQWTAHGNQTYYTESEILLNQ